MLRTSTIRRHKTGEGILAGIVGLATGETLTLSAAGVELGTTSEAYMAELSEARLVKILARWGLRLSSMTNILPCTIDFIGHICFHL